MADENLNNCGLYFDELNKIRVLEPAVAQQTSELKEECKDFMEKINKFQAIADEFIDMVEKLSNEVEKEKMKAIGARNLIKSLASQREAEQQQMQALILEKKMELERLRIQYESLAKTEQEQQELIDHLVQQK